MKPEKALQIWSEACDRTGVAWYLYKETLLCANGYHNFPDQLPCAQIAVRARDLPDLVDYVFPSLPQKWKLSTDRFVTNKRELVFQVKHTPVLEINVLYAVEDEAQLRTVSADLKKRAAKASRKISSLRSINRLGKKVFGKLYTKTFGRVVNKILSIHIAKAFRAVVTLAGDSDEKLPFYCDCFTNKKPVMFSRDLFSDTLMLTCCPPQPEESVETALPGEEVTEAEAATVTYDTTAVNTEEAAAESEEAVATAAEDADEAVSEEPAEDADEATRQAPAGEMQCPVFSGYRDYLAAIYGDYENGLFDEIGCGLTVEEKDALRKHQARCFEALTFVQELSKEFGLRYYLIAGSVLGAVRHGGFIPWDDDIDIGIRVEEIEAFEAVVREHLPQRLPEGFTLEQSGADNPYPRMFSKICYEGRCCIDLWPLIPTYKDGMKAKLLWYFGKVITKVHYQKIGHEVTKYQKIVKLASALLSDKMVMKMARRNERKYMDVKTPCYINLYSIYRRNKETMQRAWLDDEATAIFNGLEVPVVGHTKVYLTHLYGNFMGFPLPWKRVSRHVARF